MNKIICLAAVAAAMTGCVSVHKNDGGNDCLQPDVIKDSVHLKYQMDNKTVSSTETVKWVNLGFISFAWGGEADHIADRAPMTCKLPFFGPTPADIAKNGAYAKACKSSDADSMVGTRYTVTDTSYFVYGTSKAEIKGFPVRVSGAEIIPAK